MADSPRQRYSGSPSFKRRSPSRSRSRTRSRSRGRSVSRSPSPRRRSRSRSASPNRVEAINPGNTLYVTGLSTRVTERDLEDHFAKKGKVANCLLVVEPRTRLSRGFAFVTMDSNDDAERCIKHLNQSVLLGRYITVEKLDEFPAIGFSCIASTKHSQNFPTKQPQHLLQLSTTNRRTLATLGGHLVTSTSCNLSRRKRPRTPTPGNYLGVKNARDGYRPSRGRYRGGGGYGREDYGGGGYRRSPRRSPYRGGREYSPRRSPYGGRSRRERSYSPYGSPDRGGYGRRGNGYGR